MSVDSIGGGGSRDPNYEVRRRMLEEERSRELDRIEKKKRDDIDRAEEARQKSLESIYADQSSEIQSRQEAAEHRIEQIKDATESRIKAFEAESSRMTDEAKRQFQSKADLLQKNAKEIDEQRKFMLKQHSDSMRKLKEQREQAANEQTSRMNRESAIVYGDQQQRLAQMRELGEAELNALKRDLNDQKLRERAEATRDLYELQEQRDANQAAVSRQIQFNERTGAEQALRQKAQFDAQRVAQDEEFKNQLSNATAEARRAVNSAQKQGRKNLSEINELYATQIDAAGRAGRTKLRDLETQSQKVTGELETQAKTEQILMKQGYDHKKQLIHERNEKLISEHNDRNTELQQKHKEEQSALQKTLTARQEKLLTDQVKQYQGELQMQKDRGNKQFNAIVAATIEKVSDHGAKASDPFYRVHALGTSVADTEMECVVQVSVPEHEQESIRVTRQADTITVSGSRRYQGKMNEPDGRKTATNSFQSFSESFPVRGKLEMSRMTKTYADGMLTFKIPKG
ncbi:MAG: Hsp20 family protein [Bdellovibrionota bacterium]